MQGIVIVVYVDDFLLIGKSLADINKLKDQLKGEFDTKDLGLYSYFLRMRIIRNRKERTTFLV